jgi:ketosteroid isomerase-like protein
MSAAPSVRSFEPPTVPFSMHHSDPQDDVDIAAEDPIAFRDPVAVAGGRPMVAEEILLVHREDADDEIDDREPVSGIGKVFVTLLVLVALAGLGWVGWQHRAQIEQTQAWTASRAWVMNFLGKSTATGAVTGSAPAAAPPSAAALPPVGDSGSASGTASDAGPPAGSTPAASGSASTLTEGPVPAAGTSAGGGTSVAGPPASSTSGVAATPTPEDAAAAEKAAQEEKLSELDPAKWLQNWADAMRGTDAALLAQYYADPVNRYYLQSHVSRARVMADKEATIAKREQPWTVHLENVQVLDQTQTTARVLLIKHFSMGAGATARQVRWPTQLRLKTIDGRWEITAEQTLGE